MSTSMPLPPYPITSVPLVSEVPILEPEAASSSSPSARLKVAEGGTIADPTSPVDPSVVRFKALAEELANLYSRKNADYGDSFGRSVRKYGPISALTRISDKFNRLEQLMLHPDAQCVMDEKLDDTLRDLASYAIMTIIALEG